MSLSIKITTLTLFVNKSYIKNRELFLECVLSPSSPPITINHKGGYDNIYSFEYEETHQISKYPVIFNLKLRDPETLIGTTEMPISLIKRPAYAIVL